MDLRVSVEKAKKMREEALARERAAGPANAAENADAKAVAPAPQPIDAASSACQGSGAPIYFECRTVKLDPDRLLANRCVCMFPDAPELSHYKLLRTQIMHRCRVNNWNTIMITSAVPGEGKTITAINLAMTFAKAFDQTALLVDCDLKRQSIRRYLGVESPKGLADYLQNGTPLKDIIFWPEIEKLTVISGGATVRNSAELISSPKMAQLASEMKARYPDRYILFDAPPLLSEPDAMAFAPHVDAILMVTRPETSFDDLQAALDLIPKDKFLGFALNGIRSPADDYYKYAYGYQR
jgi:non-specific protein-tyrosine kinase